MAPVWHRRLASIGGWQHWPKPEEWRELGDHLLRAQRAAALAAAAKAWSENESLTETLREAWYAEAARIQSKPRLWFSGPLKAQRYVVGFNSVKEGYAMALLVEPPGQGGRRADDRRQKTEGRPQVRRLENVPQPIIGSREAATGATPCSRRAGWTAGRGNRRALGPGVVWCGSGGGMGALQGRLRECLISPGLRCSRTRMLPLPP